MRTPTQRLDRAASVAADTSTLLPDRSVTIIGSVPMSIVSWLREVWDYRELLYFLAWRDVKVRYKQTVLGAAWAILQPFTTMVVFSIFFGYLAHLPSDGIPYPVFSYSALVPWTFFATAVTQATNSLIAHERVITKVYFPRLVLPVAALLAGIPDLLIAFAVLIILMLAYGIRPTVAIVATPLFAGVAMMAALAAGLWLSALNVQYRDLRYVTPFLIQCWLFATPIVYPSTLLPEPWRTLYGINPMAGAIEGIRWALLGIGVTSPTMLLISIAATTLLLVGGAFYFRHIEMTFADVV